MPLSLEDEGEGDDEAPVPARETMNVTRETKRQARKSRTSDKRLYTLEVAIISGPITKKFAKKNRAISRTIEIRGDQTLQDLHRAIFDAFDREEEHMYEFQVGGKGPMDPGARSYVLPMAMNDPFTDRPPAGSVTRTAIGSLSVKVGEAFGYWFDFGDDWWHQINVLAVARGVPRGRYPRVTKRVGESPRNTWTGTRRDEGGWRGVGSCGIGIGIGNGHGNGDGNGIGIG